MALELSPRLKRVAPEVPGGEGQFSNSNLGASVTGPTAATVLWKTLESRASH